MLFAYFYLHYVLNKIPTWKLFTLTLMEKSNAEKSPWLMRRSNRNFNVPRAKPGHLNFWRLDRSNFRPLGRKWCSNFLPYRRRDFVCQMSLLKNNRRRFLTSVIKLVYIRGRQRCQFKMESYFRRCLRGTRYALRTRNSYQLVSHLRRMLFEWHCILQFISQRGFSFDSAFFSLSLFTAILWLF